MKCIAKSKHLLTVISINISFCQFETKKYLYKFLGKLKNLKVLIQGLSIQNSLAGGPAVLKLLQSVAKARDIQELFIDEKNVLLPRKETLQMTFKVVPNWPKVRKFV
eukprot:snap_masked-scaffold_90-processed-gene-0.1-mRNA-1 protein AED:1.00 eAED:1.00 QI:0/0/0/0/1/1/4/0/106